MKISEIYSIFNKIILGRLKTLLREQELTVIHLHLKATSRTVLSRNEAAILTYLMILGSSACLAMKEGKKKREKTRVMQ